MAPRGHSRPAAGDPQGTSESLRRARYLRQAPEGAHPKPADTSNRVANATVNRFIKWDCPLRQATLSSWFPAMGPLPPAVRALIT